MARFARAGRARWWWLAVAIALALAFGAAPAQADPFAYVTNGGSGSVSQYDAGAGGLLAPLVPATVPAGDGPVGVAVNPDGRSVYVTNYGSDSCSATRAAASASSRSTGNRRTRAAAKRSAA